MPPEPREKRHERADEQRRDDERNPETGGIGAEQRCPLAHRFPRSRQSQDDAEDGADARRPAKREGKPHDECAGEARAPCPLDARLAIEQPDPEKPEEIEAHGDDQHTGDDAEHIEMAAKQRADRRGPGAQRHEYGREAQNERDGREKGAAQAGLDRNGRRLGRPAPAGQRFQRRAGHVAQIGRHERQHARGYEGDQAGDKRRDVADVCIHGRGTGLRILLAGAGSAWAAQLTVTFARSGHMPPQRRGRSGRRFRARREFAVDRHHRPAYVPRRFGGSPVATGIAAIVPRHRAQGSA